MTKMTKTTKTRNIIKKAKTMKNFNKCCTATFHGINKWYQHMFEHLGWMVLAKNKGYTDKIIVYKNSLIRLKMAIEKKLKSVSEHDRKEDLMIMHRDVDVLLKHVMQDFK